MVRRSGWRAGIVLLGLTAPAAAQSEPEAMNWQEAVFELTAERTRAENCASALKSYGDATQIAAGQRAYGDARAEINAVIAALIVALAEDEEPAALSELEARMTNGVETRRAFCAQVDALVPAREGDKGPLADLMSGALGPVIEALVEIWKQTREEDRLRRATIRTQLEAAQWPAFDSIAA